jgi:glycosyltransferase involved in cell wall biosynthesis
MARAMNERRARSGALFVGRLDAEGGIGTLLEALDLYPGARVEVIGAGPEEPRLRAHARVRLLGRVAVYEPQEPAAHAPQEKPRRTPKIEYRTRRWRPDGPRDE